MAATNKENKEAKKDQIYVLKANRELFEKALKENREAVIQVAENVNKIASEIVKSMCNKLKENFENVATMIADAINAKNNLEAQKISTNTSTTSTLTPAADQI